MREVKGNSISRNEAFALIASISGKRMNQAYSDKAKEGIVYYSNFRKMQSHYLIWQIIKDIKTIHGMHDSCYQRDGLSK